MFANKPRAARFLRFCTVGVGNTAVDFTAFFLLALGGMSYLAAQALSYAAGIVNSYFLNRRWTFRVVRKANALEAGRFIIVNALSLLVSLGLLAVLHDENQLSLWLSKFIATGGGLVVNYIGSRLWVFSENRKTSGEIS
jgi:putative flippase GtrA